MAKKLFTFDYFGYFSLCDPAGIVFFQKVFELAHHSLEDYISSSKIGWKNWFDHPVWAVPLIHCESDFISPMKSGEEIHVDLYLESTTNSSVTFSYTFTQEGKECCRVTTSHVFISKRDQRENHHPKNYQ